MAIDLNKIRARRETAQNRKNRTTTSSKSRDLIWKPEEGKQVVRIVPNQYQPEDPFIELKFHYQFTTLDGRQKTYISPSNFGKPDPVIELSDRLKKSGDTTLWKQGCSLEPKARTYVPIVIRGREEEGIKFWGFGNTIYEELLAVMDEPDYGDITDLNKGYDIQVDFTPPEKSNKTSPDGRKFPDTKIFIKPKPRPVLPEDMDPIKAKKILELITTGQPQLSDTWECPSYEELAKVVEEKLKKVEKGKAASQEETNENVVIPTEEEIEAATKSVTPVTNVVSDKTEKREVDTMTAVFDELFNDKS